jgi:GT2 family glycosyltransferase/glycosyltransferase involved in cell wall biosynthesis
LDGVRRETATLVRDLDLGGAATRWRLDQHHRRFAASAVAAGATYHDTPVLVIIDARRDGDVDASFASVMEQLWQHRKVQVVGAAGVATDDGLHVASFADALAGAHPRQPVVVMAAGDRLEDDALFRIVDAFWENPVLRLVHWDDDVAGSEPRCRPTWSPDLLLSANPLGRSFALRAADWAGRELPATDLDWWRLILELDLRAAAVRRIPIILASLISRPDACPPGAEEVVAAELARRRWPAVPRREATAVQLDWRLESWPKVTIIIPSRCNQPLLEVVFNSLIRTDYPDFAVRVIDNSGEDPDKTAWYESWRDRLDLSVQWWTAEPFNYSAVNNAAAAATGGEVLVFLNDDTEAVDPRWLRHVVGWATRPEVGTVGLQMRMADGRIQHGGVILGMEGFAGHLFGGLAPNRDTLIGHTSWTRNTLAVTAACVTIRRDLFEEIGGFDERFVLCGSDVVLGLDAHARGLRNVCSAAVRFDHLESATRGAVGVPGDLFASWWRYQRWLKAGDPYYSPNLRLEPGEPELTSATDPGVLERVGPSIGRSFGVFRQSMSEAEATMFASVCHADDALVDGVRAQHRAREGRREVRTVNWFLPDFDNPFYGGVNSFLRIADQLRRDHGVENRFVILAGEAPDWYGSAIRAAFPGLADAPLVFAPLGTPLEHVPPADAAIATMWYTAYAVASAPDQARRFYLIQDFEPGFYPAGTMYALAEESYRLGLYGICNTEPMATMYRNRYGGMCDWFLPALDTTVFHGDRPPRPADDPVRIFLYARPGHWRNCWEIASRALEAIKRRHGDRVHIVTAGSWARSEDLGRGIEHLGLLDYGETGELYRTCDIGIALTVSEHPSYLPGELMACGAVPVAFDIPEASWIIRHGETGLLSRRTADSLEARIETLVSDPALLESLRRRGLEHIAAHHADWDRALSGVYDLLCEPDAPAASRRPGGDQDGPIVGKPSTIGWR